MRYVHNIYKVRDIQTGEVVFRGSTQEIADKYFVAISTVSQVARGKSKTLLRQYTLEYDGEEVVIK